jgi:hypothetical protein
MNTPTSSHATAFNMPLPDALSAMERSAKELQQACEKTPAKASFGQRIAKAVRAKMPAQHADNTPEDEQQTFGQALATKVRDRARRCPLTRH